MSQVLAKERGGRGAAVKSFYSCNFPERTIGNLGNFSDCSPDLPDIESAAPRQI